MPNSEERRQLIEERKQQVIGRRQRLWVRNGRRDFDVFEVPVDGLVLNVDNRRFRAERMLAEEQLGRSIDPENYPADEQNIESLLLDSSHRLMDGQIVGKETDDYVALKRDWLHRGQDSPFWIRPNGEVRNGNRRLAMVKRLQREEGDIGLQWVEAVILDPTEFDEPTLLEMEQREQLTENYKVRYNDIDYLLALKEAAENRDIDWYVSDSIDEVAGQLQTTVEQSRREVVRDLYAIRYMDSFLEDSNQSGQYHKLLKTLEKFRDIGATMRQVEEEYPLEVDQILQVLFAAVRANKPHGDIRTIRSMLKKDRERFDKLADEIEVTEDQFQSGGEPPLVSSPVTEPSAEEDEDDDDGDGEGPDVTNYPKAQVARAIEVAIDGFKASGQSDVLRTLREIRNRLQALDEGNLLRQSRAVDDESSQEVGEELRAIVAWVEENRHLADS